MVTIKDIKKFGNARKRRKFIKRLVRLPLASLNFHLRNYNDVVWVVGDGRSGTTWLSSLINWRRTYREIFEPVHPVLVRRASFLSFNQYIRPVDRNHPATEFFHSVFSGEFKHLRADTSKLRLFYDGLLVKDIFANLLIAWVHENFPEVHKRVMIVRNPFSVALSKQRCSNSTWMTNPKQFLNQLPLMQDYLIPNGYEAAQNTSD